MTQPRARCWARPQQRPGNPGEADHAPPRKAALDKKNLVRRAAIAASTATRHGSLRLMLHLEGNNAPVDAERDEVATKIVGTVPDDLDGTYYRNGPNPRTGWSPHLYAGDGMVHAITLTPDRAPRYR